MENSFLSLQKIEKSHIASRFWFVGFFFFFVGVGVGVARQVLYYLRHTLSLFSFLIFQPFLFSQRESCTFVWGQLQITIFLPLPPE
jgi:hypothetical protein